MTPAEIMGSVYRGLLRRIELDKFRVFEKDYQLSKMEKAGGLVLDVRAAHVFILPLERVRADYRCLKTVPATSCGRRGLMRDGFVS